MAQLRVPASRPLTAAVWGSGALLGVVLVQVVTGWGSDLQERMVNDLAYVPVTVMTAVLGLGVVLKADLDRRERRAWVLLEVSFVCQVVAHAVSLVRDFLPGLPQYPSISDYLYLVAIPFVVAGLLLLPVARRSRAERLRLLIDSLIIVAGACMVLWYLEIGPLLQSPSADTVAIAFSTAVPVLDLLLMFALILLLLLRPEAGTAVALLSGSMALKVVADSTYTVAYIHFNVYFRPGSWPFLLWAAGAFLTLLAVHRRLCQAGPQHTERQGRGRFGWLAYGAIVLAYALIAFVVRDQAFYPLGGMVFGGIAITTLVIARQMFAQRENRRLAVTDPLTGLSNRALIAERLTAMIRQPPREGRHSAVLLIDLDRFKPINDTYGHEAGDAVLKAVATALRAVIRSGDTAGRLGGDEFAVVLPALPSRAAAEGIASRLVDALRTPVILGEVVLGVEASIGVAFRDETTADTEQLIAHADAAMYAVKRSGRGHYRVYTPELDTRTRDADLRRAVADDELVVHFQPVVALTGDDDGRAVEALVRWNHPTRGLLMPGDFIELAEETGAVIPLGEWVLRESCRQAAGWRAEDPDGEAVRLSVNLSARQVVQDGLVETIRSILAETGFPADHLVLELTESVILQPSEQTVACLSALRAMGIGISVDDFGTGYAALSYLRALPVSILKIDRSFIAGIAVDPDAYAVTEAVVRLAKAYRLDVVAEGIETAEQARCLVQMGCGQGQGYYFARPMPGHALAEFWRRGAASTPETDGAATAMPAAAAIPAD